MPTEVILPRVDMDMATGKISRWFVDDAGAVEKGAPLFEIETDKAAMEVESPASGVLRLVSDATGQDVAVGSIVAWIYTQGEAQTNMAVGDAPVAPAAPEEHAPPSRPAMHVTSEPKDDASRSGLRATPLARRLARQNGVSIEGVGGTGPRGRVQSVDVLALLGKPQPRQVLAQAVTATGGPDRADLSGDGLLHRVWLRRGDGLPLVMLHGFGADLSGWRPLVDLLPGAAPVLAVDLPSHGQSSAVGGSDLAAIEDAVSRTIEAEGVDRLVLVGHSLGAAVATMLAGRFGDRVGGLALLSPAGLGPDIDGAFLDGFLRAESEASLRPWMLRLVADEDALSPALVAGTLRQRTRGGLVDGQRVMASHLFRDGTQTFTVRKILAGLSVPTRVVFGEADRIIPAAHVRSLPGRVAVHLFQGVGHLPHFEARQEMARIIAETYRVAT
ncbi:acetoin dehydrogenase dihydrolipoyllysine-residue acetyltransferase subunit [Alsobacter metallidurans]|uniref:Acetoin dehydrogenase dihydrolipoyllysine-residue acetyltransferase subunit n=1 Tax=Alsobacter metallidurans TaxID=340221 RepID=A0A917I5X6_9HYPH|nr:acetoin dehydrogenase dihydrolipoyllysine-residue acetyltransferase subunit [Alsobacter metallidurans]GGH16254.1 acetoin dehydrogenase dihydrolipoyllysine-residue acetyltransferase subunit [Alsobacter metallidurans]